MRITKQVVTIRLEPDVLAFVDLNAGSNDESRSTIINHIVKTHMKQLGMQVTDGQIIIEPPKSRKTGSPVDASTIMNRIR